MHLAGTLLSFVDRYNQTAQPFNWKFTAADLTRLLDKIGAHEHAAQNPAELPEKPDNPDTSGVTH